MKRTIFLFPLILILASCYQPPVSRDGNEIALLTESWHEALNAGDVDALVALYTDDARVMAPNEEMTQGEEAVRAAFGGMIEAGLTGKLNTLETRIAGDIGYHVGTYELSAGGAQVDTGKFIEIWRKTDDGWKISSDIWNSDNPVAPSDGDDQAVATVLGVHQVGDADVWLAAWSGEDSRRKLFKAHGVTAVRVFQGEQDPNLTGLLIDVADMERFQAMLQSDEGQQAAAEDTVDMSTLNLFREVE